MQPPAHMFRYMVLHSIVYGAQGIVVFGMPVGLYEDMKPLGWDWGYWRNAVLPVLKELRSPGLADALAVRQSSVVERHTLGDRRIPIDTLTLKAPNGDGYLLATRSERKRGEPRDAEVSIPRPDGGTISDRLAPHDARVYRL